MLTDATKRTLAITANWTSWIRFFIDNAVLSGKLQLAKISEARTKSQL